MYVIVIMCCWHCYTFEMWNVTCNCVSLLVPSCYFWIIPFSYSIWCLTKCWCQFASLVLFYNYIIPNPQVTRLCSSSSVRILLVISLTWKFIFSSLLMPIHNIAFRLWRKCPFYYSVEQQLCRWHVGSTMGVVQYCSRKRLISCCHTFPSLVAVFNAFPKGWLNLSTSAFPWGHLGVDECLLMLRVVRYRS